MLKPLAFLIAATTIAGTAWTDSWGYYFTDRSWIAIDTGAGPVVYNLDGSASPSFQGADLGEIPAGGSLIIVSYDTKTWKNNADISDCQYFFKLDDGQDFSIGGGWMDDLSWSDQKWGNGDVYLDVAEGLSPGPHTLSIHGRITGNPDPSGIIWEPSETTYYTATFTIAEPVQTVTFDANGGEYPAEEQTMKFVVGEEYSGIEKPTWAGHQFLGWYDDPTGGTLIQNGMVVSEAAELTLYERWKELVISSFSMKRTEATNIAEMTFDASAGSKYEILWTTSLDAKRKVLTSVTADKDGELPVSVDVPDSDTGFFRRRLGELCLLSFVFCP